MSLIFYTKSDITVLYFERMLPCNVTTVPCRILGLFYDTMILYCYIKVLYFVIAVPYCVITVLYYDITVLYCYITVLLLSHHRVIL